MYEYTHFDTYIYYTLFCATVQKERKEEIMKNYKQRKTRKVTKFGTLLMLRTNTILQHDEVINNETANIVIKM
jgi:hypothetical protein